MEYAQISWGRGGGVMGGVSADFVVATGWSDGWSIRRFRGVSAEMVVARGWSDGWSICSFGDCEGVERWVEYSQISWLRGGGVVGGVSADFVA